MERRVTITRSLCPNLPNMNASVVLLLCGVVGSALGYYQDAQLQYNVGPRDPYAVAVSPNFLPEPSQRLFFGGGQGSNQVGGTGLWAMITNKFPFLGNMFGRMELAPEYGVPNQISTQYGPPQYHQQYQQQYQPPIAYQAPQNPVAYQNYLPPQVYQQQFRQFGQNFVPAVRDVGFTDDAVIVTPPHVPVGPQPAPQPLPQPIPQPVPIPQPSPSPSPDGYNYNKPQYRLELPRK